MKKFYTFVIIALIGFIGSAQIVNIPDANFKARLLAADTNNMIAMDLSYNYFKIDSNNDGEIQVSEANQVSSLALDNSGISNLTGINYFPNIYALNCSNNQIITLDLNNNTNIYYLYCNNNQLTSLNITGLTHLTWLFCDYNNLTSLSITPANSLQKLRCFNNQISSLTVSGFPSLTELNCRNNNLSSLNVEALTNLQVLDASNNSISTLSLTNLINLTRLDFETNLITNLDTTNLTLLTFLNCANNQIVTLNLDNLSALTTLNCANNLLTSLNLSATPNLRSLTCNSNNLGTINISSLTQLQDVTAVGCNLTQFTSGEHPALQTLILYDNLLTTLSINNLTSLNYLGIGKNNYTSLNIDSLVNLTEFECYLCEQLSTISFQNNVNLNSVTLAFTSLTTLDFSALTNNLSQQLAINDNALLNSINVKNGVSEANFSFSNCPNLQYICADENEIETIQNQITQFGYTNCHVNSYCSFTPGGTFYTIQGNNRYDSNNNGCDAADINFPNLKLSFTDGITTGNLIANTTGAFHYDVQAGTQTITPTLENPTYFTVSPLTSSVNFPTTASPFLRDFCVSANGTHDDLEIAIFPLTTARPGFDADYKIIYKNKGTSTQSGTVSFDYYDPIEDFVSATPNFTSQATNTLNWSFSNLNPFERREILVTFNLNSPLETPALNVGNLITYAATISGTTDETPSDNISNLTQTIVNSFDPNDKTCVEGALLPDYEVGKYLHYIIRFENTGTANAENVVVKDMIDITKLDINTLVPLSGSHAFETKISSTNKVEFIFQNINLPFDDANNDGYVAFKIKTLPTLFAGAVINNSANIYFDYNAPIVTNTSVVNVFNPLATPDFEFGSVFTLSPIPAKNSLIITSKQEVMISSANIYNTLGQLVQVVTNPSETIDVSGLTSGSYFIKIISDKGTASAKFMKE